VEKTGEHGLWTLCPAGDTTNTPLVETTGADNGNGRRRLRSLDLITLKQRLDNLKVPAAGRTLVLCSAHVADLLVEDQSFQLRYNNTEKGTIMPNFYAKKAFGAAAAGTDRNASTLFFAPRAFQASGTVEMYYEDKFTNPTMRQTVVGFSLYHVIAPMKNIGFGSIVSDDLL
jgi:hypothetical protein